ncbi:MAG: DUF2946 family protein [Gammaproteobacteria bacterium]|nr:DUF2946 family protein [Gammaproteobacteria bacterium]MDX2461286.1 DUF2946 family protein [Gammaproteobacteria bacterium]
MDHSVIGAMARWPDVPAVFGWLSLDRRGRWCLRGEPVSHRGAIAFMNRNYGHTGDGRWYFQNGPQRVFVDLEYTPWIYTLDGSHSLVDHTGNSVGELRSGRLDEEGNLLLVSARGVGLLCDRDLAPVSDRFRLADGAACDEDSIGKLMKGDTSAKSERVFLEWAGDRIEVEAIVRAGVAGEFGFEPRPRASAGDA